MLNIGSLRRSYTNPQGASGGGLPSRSARAAVRRASSNSEPRPRWAKMPRNGGTKPLCALESVKASVGWYQAGAQADAQVVEVRCGREKDSEHPGGGTSSVRKNMPKTRNEATMCFRISDGVRNLYTSSSWLDAGGVACQKKSRNRGTKPLCALKSVRVS